MKRFLLAAALLVASTAAIADSGIRYAALGYCQLTSLGTAVLISTCSGGIPAGATTAVLRTEAQAIRWRDDGTAPQAGVGMPLLVADPPYFYTGPLAKLRVIESTSGAKLNITFYK